MSMQDKVLKRKIEKWGNSKKRERVKRNEAESSGSSKRKADYVEQDDTAGQTAFPSETSEDRSQQSQEAASDPTGLSHHIIIILTKT